MLLAKLPVKSTSLHPGPLSFVDVITGRAEIRWICGKQERQE